MTPDSRLRISMRTSHQQQSDIHTPFDRQLLSVDDGKIAAIAAVIEKGLTASAGGLYGSSVSFVIAQIASVLNRNFLVIAPGVDSAELVYEDISTFLGYDIPLLFPMHETLVRSDAMSPSYTERLNVLLDVQKRVSKRIIIASVNALLQDVPSPELIQENSFVIEQGARLDLDRLLGTLASKKFTRSGMVEMPGEFAVRGGIVDVYPYSMKYPLRIELAGDVVESMRFFEVSTQISIEKARSVSLPLLSQNEFFQARHLTSSLLNYLPGYGIFIVEPAETFRRAHSFLDTLYSTPDYTNKIVAGFMKRLGKFPQVSLSSLPAGEGDNAFRFHTASTQRFSGDMKSIFAELKAIADETREARIFCHGGLERKRFEELAVESGFDFSGRLKYATGFISKGVRMLDYKIALIPYGEIFGRYRHLRPAKETAGYRSEGFYDFEKGDYVVHLQSGIGKFLGVRTLRKGGRAQDHLVLEYQDGVKLYVPVSQSDLVEKYVGSGDARPELSRIGTDEWDKKKCRVQLAVNNLAKDLLEIQGVRRQEMGIAYPQDTPWQNEFEASFPFEDTVDQVQITQEIKKDMESRKPMDRLICGDVGYGKTELAMRAAFKAAVAGRQVAVLVPTTILAQQHYKNFAERMSDYPLKIGILSRFKTKKEQHALIEMLAGGEIDIVIGTHRLLQKDIKFRNLGLAIVDEEQRFGVENKEFFKKMRATVDVLTLTATPIPRTLHMALMGVRDISNLLTPPPDRRAIKTEVCFYDEKKIREGILNELNRDGQVFFVHNRVMDIDNVADRIRYIVPEARVNVVHGQMRPELLEERMLEFITGDCNVLVTTTIIESGVDIPNANTLFVNEADYFGLADLHQLRGRVGRYKNQAYAYFLLPRHRPLTPESEKRIKAIEEYMELGAGFKIAVRDLEIRGAGNMLGREQSGHIMSVGYDLYCRLLHQAVRRIKNEKVDEDVNCVISLNIDSNIPDAYMPDERQRLHFYKLLSKCRGVEEVDAVRNIIIDMYGSPPEEMEPVFDMARIKILSEKAGIYEITQSEDALEFRFTARVKAEAVQKALNGGLRFIDDRAAFLPLKGILKSREQLSGFLKNKLSEITFVPQ